MFLRIFRRAIGLTPYQFLLNTRLRQAALRLPAGPDAVSAAACDTGFGDLSTFNAAFRARFGAPPGFFRRDRASPVPSLP
ncbi:MAG: helix-turn-helix domain-containing protein [Pseudomonadota bacterium]|nr:helix-turn-helix domain-containing protein [Pseudomonadota bacterium]